MNWTQKHTEKANGESELPKQIAIGKLDGALVDENGLYIGEATKREIVIRYNQVEGFVQAYKRARENAEGLARALQAIIEIAGITKPADWEMACMEIEATAHVALRQWQAFEQVL
jgi:hypothetical protein